MSQLKLVCTPLTTLQEVQGNVEGYDKNGLPAAPTFDHIPAEETAEQRKKRKQHEKCVLEAYAKAVEAQKQRIKQCEDYVKEQKLGKVNQQARSSAAQHADDTVLGCCTLTWICVA